MSLDLSKAKSATFKIDIDMSELFGDGAGFMLEVVASAPQGWVSDLQVARDTGDAEGVSLFLERMIVSVADLADGDGQPVTTYEQFKELPAVFGYAAAQGITEAIKSATLAPKARKR